jgi:hypothetical protein
LEQLKVEGKIEERMESFLNNVLPSFGCMSGRKERLIFIGPTPNMLFVHSWEESSYKSFNAVK